MNTNKILKIFMHPQEFPCGEQSSCCGPIGQTEEDIQKLRSGIERELCCKVEVLNVKNEEQMKNHPRIKQLLQSLGPNALPILTLDGEVVSIGNNTPEAVLAAIREKADKKNAAKDDNVPTDDNSEEARQQSPVNLQPCCPSTSDGDDCCSLSGSKGWKTVIFILVVVAAGVVLAHSLIGKSNSAIDQTQPLFATIPPESNPHTPSLPNDTIKKEISDKAETTLWGQELDSLASLNKVAADTDAVFVFLAADSRQGDQTITSQIEAAAKTLQSNGIRISAFTLKKDSLDYTQLAKQSSIPCVLAMVKSRGASAVSGEITDTKLVQAFVTASRSVSGCGPAGCGPTGCGPAPAKPGPRR